MDRHPFVFGAPVFFPSYCLFQMNTSIFFFFNQHVLLFLKRKCLEKFWVDMLGLKQMEPLFEMFLCIRNEELMTWVIRNDHNERCWRHCVREYLTKRNGEMTFWGFSRFFFLISNQKFIKKCKGTTLVHKKCTRNTTKPEKKKD